VSRDGAESSFFSDIHHFVVRLRQIVELSISSDSPRSVLEHAVKLGAEALQADAASFVEYSPTGGRVVAATEQHQHALGRRVVPCDHTLFRLLSRPIRVVTVEELPREQARYLAARGLRRVVVARVELRGQLVGSLQIYFRDRSRRLEPIERELVRLLAAGAAHLYADGEGALRAEQPVATGHADGTAVLNADGEVLSWDPPATAELTDRRKERVLGNPAPIPVPPPGQVLNYRLADGRWLAVRSSPMGDTDGCVVAFQDITEAKQREEDKDLFIALTSHELRTPVTVVRGYAETLVRRWDDLDDAERRTAVELIERRTRDLVRVIDRLLTGTYHPAEGIQRQEVFDLCAAVRAAVGQLAEELRHRVTLKLPDELPAAIGAPTTLPEVITELVTNAHKYSPCGGEITVRAGADDQTVYLQVADRGIGVRPEHVERAFERFWQAEVGDQRRFGGVGLGLYLVRRIVERQGGWVSLRPRTGGGTVAEVRLPRADVGS